MICVEGLGLRVVIADMQYSGLGLKILKLNEDMRLEYLNGRKWNVQMHSGARIEGERWTLLGPGLDDLSGREIMHSLAKAKVEGERWTLLGLGARLLEWRKRNAQSGKE